MFDADRPITKSDQDRLNRTLFAKYLARCLLDHKDDGSFVVGLYGKAGVGKTSLINLMIEELNFAASNMEEPEKPIVLNFNAWSYSGQNQLVYSFFRRLSSTLRRVPHLKNRDRIIHLLELYVSFFTRKPVPKKLRTKRTLWEKLTLQGKEEVYAWESGQDLTLIKAELIELLQKQYQKIIIFIDNISQLYPEEVKQIFQIVKTIGDYANTIYVLAFNKQQIVSILHHMGAEGECMLEKIVQMPFEIPPIMQQDVEKLFADRLNPILSLVPEGAWNAEYWADIYYHSLHLFFTNVRDISRYVNTLHFSYPRLRDVVNPVDFFALTAIEVFIPDVYFGIRDNKDLFTDLLDNVYELSEEEIIRDRARLDEILARNQKISSEILLDLLMDLFPRLRHIYQPKVLFWHSDSLARKLRRICSPDLFEVYFRLSMQSPELSSTEFETLLSIADEPILFDQALTRLNQDDRIAAFLTKLDGKALHTIPQKRIQAIVTALLDNGDLFPQGVEGPLTLDTPMRIHRIVHGLLSRFKNPDERFLILENAIANATKSLFILVYEIVEQSREHREETDTFLPVEFRDLLPNQLDLLRKLVVSRIEYWAKGARLIEHPRLLSILIAWMTFSDGDACRQFVRQMTQTDKGLVAFLVAIFKDAIFEASHEYHKNPAWQKYLEDIEIFIPVNALIPHAKLLFENNYFEKLREQEQLALMIFLDLVKADTKKTIPKTTV